MMSSAVGAANADSIEYPIARQMTTLGNRQALPRHIEADAKRDRKKGMKAQGWILER